MVQTKRLMLILLSILLSSAGFADATCEVDLDDSQNRRFLQLLGEQDSFDRFLAFKTYKMRGNMDTRHLCAQLELSKKFTRLFRAEFQAGRLDSVDQLRYRNARKLILRFRKLRREMERDSRGVLVVRSFNEIKAIQKVVRQ